MGSTLCFWICSYCKQGLRWIILLQNLNFSVSKLNSIYAVAIGYFTNIAIPRAGEITRCTSLNQTEDVPVDKLFGTIILERAIDFIILLSLGSLLVLILKLELFLEFLDIIFSGRTTKIKLIYFYWIKCHSYSYFFYFFNKKFFKTSFYIKIKTFLVGMKDGFKSINGLKNKAIFLDAHTLIIWLMYLLMTYVCFFSIEATRMLNLIDGLYTMVIGGFGMVAPVQGGIGAYHYIVKKAYDS